MGKAAMISTPGSSGLIYVNTRGGTWLRASAGPKEWHFPIIFANIQVPSTRHAQDTTRKVPNGPQERRWRGEKKMARRYRYPEFRAETSGITGTERTPIETTETQPMGVRVHTHLIV